MLYSEYITLVKKEIQLPRASLGFEPDRPVTFICMAIKRLCDKTPIAYQKKLKGKIKELLTKQHRINQSTLMLVNIEVPPNLSNDEELLIKRIIFLDRMIASARKREAKASQNSLF